MKNEDVKSIINKNKKLLENGDACYYAITEDFFEKFTNEIVAKANETKTSTERGKVCLKGYEFGCRECLFCKIKYSEYCTQSKQT